MRALGLEPRTQGLKVNGLTNENVIETTCLQHSQQQSEFKPSLLGGENDLLAIAKQSIGTSRQAVENLIDFTPPADKFTLGILGPILSALQDAERELGKLVPQESYRLVEPDLE